MLGRERSASIRFVCSDMWKAFLKVAKKKAPNALHVLDRFHIMALMNKAIDEIRAGEAKRMKRDGYEPLLKHSRWWWLKRVWNLTKNQAANLKKVLQYNL
jgi:transposase